MLQINVTSRGNRIIDENKKLYQYFVHVWNFCASVTFVTNIFWNNVKNKRNGWNCRCVSLFSSFRVIVRENTYVSRHEIWKYVEGNSHTAHLHFDTRSKGDEKILPNIHICWLGMVTRPYAWVLLYIRHAWIHWRITLKGKDSRAHPTHHEIWGSRRLRASLFLTFTCSTLSAVVGLELHHYTFIMNAMYSKEYCRIFRNVGFGGFCFEKQIQNFLEIWDQIRNEQKLRVICKSLKKSLGTRWWIEFGKSRKWNFVINCILLNYFNSPQQLKALRWYIFFWHEPWPRD